MDGRWIKRSFRGDERGSDPRQGGKERCVRKARIQPRKDDDTAAGTKVAGPQAASIMSGWRVMKIAQSLPTRHLLKERTPLSPIPTTNPFNLEIINDRYALIILAPPWKRRAPPPMFARI